MKIKVFFALLMIWMSIKVLRTMETKSAKIFLTPRLIGEMSPVSAMKLIDSKQQVLFVFSTTIKRSDGGADYDTVISSTPFEETQQPPSQLFAVRQLLPPPPAWDVAVDSRSVFSLAYEEASGATYSILVRSSSGKEYSLLGKRRFQSFTAPTFVKREQDEPSRFIAAISEKRSGVLFRRDGNGNYREHSKLCDCQSLKVMAYQDGFALLYKTIIPGPVRGNATLPGRLYYAKLDKEFKFVGPPTEIFTGETIFEFDADVTPENVTILATSASGTFLAIGASLSGPFKARLFEEQNRGALFSQPSVVLSGAQIRLAILEGSQAGKVSIMSATLMRDGSQ